MITINYPLRWPPEWPRTSWHSPVLDKPSFRGNCRELRRLLSSLGASAGEISCDINLEHPGEESGHRPKDVGVALYFRWQDQQRVIACDRWNSVRSNLQAITTTVTGLVALHQAGIPGVLERTMSGFITVDRLEIEPWFMLLGLEQGFDRQMLELTYRRLRGEHHPDRGGDMEIFIGIQAAMDKATAWLQTQGRW